jgi:hypothetical protein
MTRSVIYSALLLESAQSAELSSWNPPNPEKHNTHTECKMSHLFVPCGHVCACSSCASRIMETTKMCPICCMCAPVSLVHLCEQYVQLCARVLCACDAFPA